MSTSVTVTLSVQVTGDGINFTHQFPMTTSPAANSPIQSFATANGSVTYNVPAGVNFGVWLRPPAGSATAKTVKGAAGDTGLTSWANQTIFVPATTANIVVTSTAVEIIEAIPV